MNHRKDKDEKQRLDREVHRQLDQLCDLTRRLTAVSTLCATDAQTRATLDLLRCVVLHRLGQIEETVKKQRRTVRLSKKEN